MASRCLKLTVAYDGTHFAGWQRQPGARTVQGVLEAALAEIAGRAVTVVGAGRTDSGVHAIGQVASARVPARHAPETYARALNARLPPDVRIVRAEEAAGDFHARKRASLKVYRYHIWNGATAPVLGGHLVWHVPAPLDVAAMREAATAMVGTHDFRAFRAEGSSAATTVRTVYAAEVGESRVGPGWPLDSAVPAEPGERVDTARLVQVEIRGSGFLRHMVRGLVGTLVEIGLGRRAETEMRRLLAHGARADVGATAPARGLVLVAVRYTEEADRVPGR